MRIKGRGQMVAFSLLGVFANVARNWLMLRAIGVDVSLFAAMAPLMATFTLGELPLGPARSGRRGVILGSHGIAATAAAGVLVAVTGITGSLCYAAWAISDQIVARRLGPAPELVPAPVAVALRSS